MPPDPCGGPKASPGRSSHRCARSVAPGGRRRHPKELSVVAAQNLLRRSGPSPIRLGPTAPEEGRMRRPRPRTRRICEMRVCRRRALATRAKNLDLISLSNGPTGLAEGLALKELRYDRCASKRRGIDSPRPVNIWSDAPGQWFPRPAAPGAQRVRRQVRGEYTYLRTASCMAPAGQGAANFSGRP